MENVYKNDVLTIKLPQKIDSINAPDAEKEIFSLIEESGAKRVILDAVDTEYISSAGLRVILKLKKAVANSKIINTSSEVYDIFNMTGFIDIIDVKKAFREISVEGCEIIGRGSHGTVYRINGDTILKLYSKDEPLAEIEREIEYSRNAFVAGIPTAIPFDVVKCGGSYGSVFELINADTFGNVLAANPDKYDRYLKKYIELVNTLHTTEADTNRLSSTKDLYNKWADEMAESLTADEINILHEIINSVPDRNTFVHGDIHPKNVMVQDDELVFIDLADMTYGHPVFDYMSMALTLVITAGRNPERALQKIGIDSATCLRLWNDMIKARFVSLDEAGLQKMNELLTALGMMKLTIASAVDKAIPQQLKETLINVSRQTFFPNAKNLIGAVKF